MFRISCFADEISPDFDEQVKYMKENDIKYLELRSVWEKNVLDLTDKDMEYIKDVMEKNDIAVSSIGSPIGKVHITDDFDAHMERFKKAVKAALYFNTKYIRIFSFYMDRDRQEEYREEVVSRLKKMAAYAHDNNIMLLHENEGGIYGEKAENCRKLFEQVNMDNFRAVFDPANFVVAQEEPFDVSFPLLSEYTEYIHVKDASWDKTIHPAGEGDGRIRDILAQLKDRDNMFLSLEPHLAQAGQFKGYTGPVLFKKAADALKGVLDEIGAEYI